MHTHVDRTHSLTHLHQHRYNHVVRSTSAAITEFGINFFFFFTHCYFLLQISTDSLMISERKLSMPTFISQKARSLAVVAGSAGCALCHVAQACSGAKHAWWTGRGVRRPFFTVVT